MRHYSLLVVLACLLVMLTPRADAASFYMNGICYSDISTIIEKFESQFPILDGAQGDMDFVQYPTSVTATGLLTYRIDEQKLNTGGIVLGGVNTQQLMPCYEKNIAVGANSSLQWLPVQDIIFAIGLIALWAAGYRSGLMR